jgi:hypothetical protein
MKFEPENTWKEMVGQYYCTLIQEGTNRRNSYHGTGEAINVWHKIVTRSNNHYCRGNVTMRSVCIVELNVTVLSTRI